MLNGIHILGPNISFSQRRIPKCFQGTAGTWTAAVPCFHPRDGQQAPLHGCWPAGGGMTEVTKHLRRQNDILSARVASKEQEAKRLEQVATHMARLPAVFARQQPGVLLEVLNLSCLP